MINFFLHLSLDFFLKFKIWPPDVVFVMDDWTLRKQFTVVHVCTCMCACVYVVPV